MKLPNTLQKPIILGLTLLAFLLRAYRLDFQSFWIDETWTVFFGHLTIGQLWHLLQTVEIMPPFYHPSTIYWINLVGDSEYALRFYSLIFGVAAVPLTYRLGKDLGDDRLGLLAALLMTIAPYQIWHSQEARMYSILTATSVMSMWGFVNLWQRGGWRWWLIYVIGTEWAMMTHYHGAVLIGIQGLFLLLTWRRHWRGYLGWAATLLFIFILYLPWLTFGSDLLQSYLNWIEQPTLWDAFVRSALAYSVGELVPRTQAIPLVLVFLALYGLGLIYTASRPWGRWPGPAMVALLLAYTLAPIIAAWIYGELRTTVFFERYLILIQAGYLLAVSMGILAVADGLPHVINRLRNRSDRRRHVAASSSRLAGILASILLLLLIGISGWVLSHHYFDPLYAKPDWRAVAGTIEQFSLPGDAILLTGDGGEHAFDYYYDGDRPLYFSFNLPPPTSPDHKKGRPGLAQMDEILTDITARHRRIWFTPYGTDFDPELERWLGRHTYPAWQSWLGRKRLALYDTTNEAGRVEIFNTTFSDSEGPALTLVRATLPDKPIAAGDLLPVDLIWQIETHLERDYQVSLRLTNHHGDIFAQSDWPPLMSNLEISTEASQEPVTDRRSLWLPADVPPGRYLLQFILYEPATGATFGSPMTLADIAVGPAEIVVPLERLTIPNRTDRPLAELTLVGYALPEKIQPGQEMWLWLYWQARQTPKTEVGLRLSLDSAGEAVITDLPLAASVGPLDSWQPGQVRRAVYHLPTSPRLDGDQAELSLSLLSPDGHVAAETTIAQVDLETRPRQFEPPPMTVATNLTFGNAAQLKLIGYDLPETSLISEDTLPITLYWQAAVEMDTNYTVFLQLLNQAGQVVAQVDLQPQAGAAPTTTWLPGEILADPYYLPVPDLAPGEYRLITGLYNPTTGERLPVETGNDFVELQTLTIR